MNYLEKPETSRRLPAGLICLILFLGIISGFLNTRAAGSVPPAPTSTWTGSADGNWSNPSNWSGGKIPSYGDNLVFPASVSNKSNTDDLGDNFMANSITFNDSGYTLGGSNTLLIGQGQAGITDSVSSGGNTIALNLRFDSTVNMPTRWVTVTNSAETLTISGMIAGTGGLTKEGLGDLVLSGANTYGGVTKINVGSLIAQNNTALGTIAGGTEVVGEADLELKGNIAIGREPLTLRGYGVSSGGALRNLQDNNSFAGQITIPQTTEIDSDSGSLTLSGGVTGAFNLNLDGTGNINFTTAPIAIGAGFLTKNGAGTTTFSFPNTYTGLTTVNAGKLLYGCDNAILSGGITVNGGTLDMATYSDMVGAVTLGTLAGGSGTITGTSGILSGSSYTVYVGTVSAIIAGDGSTLSKSTPGTVTLTRPNQFSGAATVSAGTLKIQDGMSLGVIDGATTVSTGATLQVDGSGLTVPEYITMSGVGLKNAGALANTTGSNTITGQITLGAAASIESASGTTLTIATGGVIGATLGLTVDGDGNTTFTGPIATTTGTLTKNGNGNLTISSYCSYSGATTVNDGTLTLSGNGSINLSTTLTLATHGTLTIDNAGAQVDRLADTAAIAIAGGDINFYGSSSGNIVETTGALTLSAGQSGMNIFTSSAGSTILRFASLTRTAGASAIVRGASLGSAPGANVATLLFTTAPSLLGDDGVAGTPTVSILQGVFGDDSTSGTGTDMVTYGRGNNYGLRLLNHAGFSNEYTSDFTMTNANVQLSTGTAAITTQINSLKLNSGASITDAGSAKTITFVSGNILNLSSYAIIGGANTTLAGGTAGSTEFIVRTPVYLEISANIATTGGLTKSGLSTLFYSTAKTYTGLTAINSGTLLYGIDNAISTGAVTVDSGTLDLATFNDSVANVTCQGGTITSAAVSGGTLTSTGTYSFRDSTISAILGGSGAVSIVNTGANVDAVTTMTRDNTLSGTITVTSGILKLGGAGGGTNTPLGTTAGATTVANGGMLDLNGFTLSTTEPITINGTGTALQGAIINSSATPVTYPGAVTLGATAPRIGADYSKITMSGNISGTVVLTVGGFSDIDLTGVLSSTMGVTKDGFGTYTPTNANSSYSGVTTISAGTMDLGADGGATNTPLGTSAGATSITAGATFDLNGHSFTGSAEPLTLNGLGSGTGDLAAGALINSSATPVTWNGVITNGTATIKANAGSINLTGATMAGTVALTLGGSGSGTIASALASGAASVVKIDSGTWTLSGQNLYTGATTIYQGTIKLGANDAATPSGPLGTAGAGTTIYSGGVVDMNGFSSSALAEALAINGFGINNGGALVNNSASGVTYLGARTLGSDSRVTNSGAGLLTLSGAQAGAFESRFGGSGNITMSAATAATASSLLKDGAGTMILSAANGHTGITTVNAGILQEGILNALAAPNVLVNGGTFDMSSFSDTVAAVTLVAGTIDSTGGGILTATGYTVESGLINGIIAGAVTMTKNTSGTVNITGAETYSGATTINAGTISLNNSGTAVSSAFTINLGGTLTLDNSTTNVASRLGDALVVTMNGGNFNLIGQDSTTITETIGQFAFVTGHNVVTIDPKAGSGGLGTTLTVANNPGFNRSAGATALFRGPNFGSTPAAGVASVIFSTVPTLTGGAGAANSKTVSVIKGAYGDNSISGTGSDMVTYNVGNTTGLRLLNGAGYTTEYQGDLSVANANVKLTASTAATANNTNSLITNGYNVTNASVTLPLASASLAGNVLINSANSIAGANTVLGITTFELDVLATANSTISATIGTAVAGSLVQSGTSNLTLSAANAYTGTTYINGGTLTEGVSNALSTGGVTEVGGVFDLAGNSDSVGAITMTAGTVKSGAGTLTTTGTLLSVANANLPALVTGTLALPAAATLNIADGLVEDDAVISATLTSAGTSLTKSGTGVSVLVGNNTYTGSTSISAGTVKLGAAGSAGNGPLGTTAAGTTVVSGAALDLNGFTLANAEATTINGTGLTANAKGAILNTKSAATSYSGLLTLGAAAVVQSDYGDINITNAGTISGATFALSLLGAGNGTVSSIVGNTTGGIVKNNSGTWTVSGVSTYTGVTTITAGVLKLGVIGDGTNSPLGTVTGGTTIASGAMLDLNGLSLSTAEPLTSVNGTGIASAGAVTTSTAGNTSFSGPITLGAASRLTNFGSGTFTLSGTVAGATFALTLVDAPGTISQTNVWSGTTTGPIKEGYGMAILAGQNSYTGAVTVSTGTLQIGANGGATNTPLGTIAGGVTVSAGAVLDLSTYVVGGASTWEPLTLNGSGINNGGALISSASSGNSFGALTLGSATRAINSGSGTINITGAVTTANNLVIGGTGPTTISGLITTAGITITKYDAGLLLLNNAANANTGLMRVNGGTLQLSGTGSIAVTPVTVAGGTFDFNGITKTIGAVTLINGTITDSNVTPGVLSGASYTFYGGAISGVLGGTAIAMTKSTGATLTMNKSMTDTGTLTVSAGTVQYLAGNILADTAPVTLTGGTLDLQSNSDTVAAVTLTSGSIIGAGTLTGASYSVASGTVGAILAGAVNLTKTTVGLVTLSGANTYSGITTISGGTIAANTIKNGTVPCSLGSATNAAANIVSNTGTGTVQYIGSTDSTDRSITTTAAITLQFDIVNPSTSFTFAGTTTGTTAPLTKVGAGTLVLSGANQHTGITSVLSGTLQYGVDNAILTAGVTVNNGTFDINNHNDSVGAIILQNGGQIIDSGGTTAVLTSTAQFDFRSGKVSAALGSAVVAVLSKSTTDRVILSGNNTFSAASNTIAVSVGVLNLQSNNALGAAGNGLTTTVTAGAALELQNNVTIPSTKTFTVNGTGVNQGGAIDNVADSNTIQGTVALGASGVRINSSTGTLTFNGAMSGGGFNVTFGGPGNTVYGGAIGTTTGTLTKDGSGTLTLSVANSYTGLTTVSAGVIVASNASSFGGTANGVSVTSGAAVQLQGSTTIGAEALTLNGTGIANDGALRSTSGTNVWQGNLTLNSTSVIGVDANSLTVSGSITGGASIGLTKVGAASLTVGATTIGGDLTVSTGTLVASGASAISVSGNWVNSGAFTPNSSTVTLSGAGGSTQIISGSTTFNNLTANAATARTINFDSGSITTVTGTWTATGSSGQNITLGRNGGSGLNQWNINPTAWTVDYVTPVNSNNQAGSSINPVHYSDGGNNTNWFSSNSPPAAPTALTQGTTTGSNNISESVWTNSNQPWFGFNITDPDSGNTVKYRIQVDNTDSGFTHLVLDYTYGSLSASGTTFAYQVGQAGTYTVGSASMTLSDSATGYWWRVYAIDNSAAQSVSPAYFGTQATIDVKVDSTAPTGLTNVYDGSSAGVENTLNDGTMTNLSANWVTPTFNVSGALTPNAYQYAIGTTPGGTDIKGWTATNSTSSSDTGLSLTTNQLYFYSVKAYDLAGNITAAVSSPGQQVMPTFTVSFVNSPQVSGDANSVDLGDWVDPTFGGTGTTQITTTTNAYHGYQIYMYKNTKMQMTNDATKTIADIVAGYASPQPWASVCAAGTACFGYTSNDASVAGSNRYNSGANYCAISDTAPGDIVADEVTPQTSGQTFTVTYKIQTNATQAAGKYQTNIQFTAVPQY